MATLIFVGTSYVRFEKDEDGDDYKRRYHQGDEIEVSNAKVERLLELEVGGRHLFVRSEKDAEEEEANMPRADVGANDPRASVPQGSVTNTVEKKTAAPAEKAK